MTQDNRFKEASCALDVIRTYINDNGLPKSYYISESFVKDLKNFFDQSHIVHLALTICDRILQEPVMDNSEIVQVAEGSFKIATAMRAFVQQLLNEIEGKE